MIATEEEAKLNVHGDIKHKVNIKEEAKNENFAQTRLTEVAEEARRHWLLFIYCFCE